MKTLIIGAGEVGRSLYEVLSKSYDCTIIDKGDEAMKMYEIMHICFPYSLEFGNEVRRYRQKYMPKYTVVHSTVPPGTCSELGVTHSPIRGFHPLLAESIKTFTKFVGGINADTVAQYFIKAGLKVYICRKAETTELGKLLSTNYYAACIEYVKDAEKLCNRYRVPFGEAFTLFQRTYNEGYSKLGYPEVQRPVLQPIQKRIGGHCVNENLLMIKSKFINFLRKLQK